MTGKAVFKSTGNRPEGLPAFTVEFGAGETIFREGDVGTEMFVVHEGRVEISTRVQEEDRPLAVLEKGDFFGEMALLEDLPRTASAKALTPVRLLQINGSTFDQLLRDNPEVAVRMMRKLSKRLRETDRALNEALGRPGAIGVLEVASAEMPLPEPPPPVAGPQRLTHDKSGMEFFLSKGSETTLGRKDPVTSIHPDIDLAPVDAQRSISRRHAKIYRRGAKFFVSEEIGTMNGTYLNGRRIETGVPAELHPGDTVRLGLVDLRFVAE